MPKAAPIIRNGFTSGVKASFDPSSVPPNALWKARDVVADISGVLHIRNDATMFGTSLGSGAIQGAREAFGKVLSVWNRNVYLTDNAGTRTQIGMTTTYTQTTALVAGTAVPASNTASIPNPTAAPTLATATTGGSLAAATYYVKYTLANTNGETLVSPEASITTTGTTSTLTVTVTAPAGATSINVYVSTSTNTETRQGNTTVNMIGATASDNTEIVRWSRNGAEMNYLLAGNGVFQTDGVTTALVTPYTPATGEKTNLIRNADGTNNVSSGPARSKLAQVRASLSQRMILAGDPQSPNTVYMSAPLDATYFPSDQVLQLPDDGSKITGMINFYNTLLIFREHDIWAFFGTGTTDPNASLVLQGSVVGCIAPRSICFVPDLGVVFLARDNIYNLQNVMAIEYRLKPLPIADEIRPLLQNALKYGVSNVSAIYYNREYRISFPNVVEQDRVFRLFLQNNAGWYVDSGPLTNQYFLYQDQLHGTDRLNGQLVKFDTQFSATTNQSPFWVQFRREELSPGPSRIQKIYIYTLSRGSTTTQNLFFFAGAFNNLTYGAEVLKLATVNTGTTEHIKVTVIVDGYNVVVKNFTVYVDLVNFSQLTISDPVWVYEARFDPSLQGNYVQLQIENTQTGENIAILGYGIDYQNRGRIHGRKIVTSS